MSFPVRIAHLAAALLLVLAAFLLPGRMGITDTGLDGSYPLVVEEAANHHAQFGKDIIYTLGPLGYLYQSQAQGLGGHQWERWLFAVLKAVFSGYVCCRLRVALWLWWMYLPPSEVMLCAGVATLLLMPSPPASPRLLFWEEWILPAFCAWAALVKFTDLMAAGVVIAGVAAVAVSRRQFWHAARPCIAFGLVYLGGWVAAGQALSNLPVYVLNSMQVATGFATMALRPEPMVLAWGLTGVVLILASLAAAIATSPRRADTLLRLLPVAACAYLSWKHGFVRADVHVMIFFSALIGYAAMITASEGAGTSRWKELLAGACLVVTLSGMISVGRFPLGELAGVPRGLWNRLHSRIAVPAETPPLLVDQSQLPLIRKTVGRAPVDILNYQQAFAYLNDLNLRPRPLIQGFSAYTPALQQIDLAFYQSDRRPDFAMLRLQTIDRRWAWLDDATLALHLLTDWTPVVREKGFLLMQPAAAPGGSWKELLKGEAKWGKKVKVPEHPPGTLLAMQLQAERRLWGKLRRFAFQGASLDIKASYDDGTSLKRNYVPEMATERVLISPGLESVDDILAWHTGLLAPRHLVQFGLTPWKGEETEFTRSFRYTLWLWTPSTSDRTAFARRLKPQLYTYLPGTPDLVKPALTATFIDGTECGEGRLPSLVEIPVPVEARGVRGRVYLDGKGDDREDILVRASLRDSSGKMQTVLDQRFSNRIEKTYDLKFNLPPALVAGPASHLVLEATSSTANNRASLAWGSFVWETGP